MAFKNYYYNQQVKKYLLQFMSIFSGLQVSIGKTERSSEEELIPVPIMHGDRDRVVGWIKGEQTQNKPIRLPMMSAVITGIQMAPEMRKGVGNVRRNSYLPRGGVVPDDIKTVRQIMPIPYKLTASLAIWSSNHEQRYQILEQILTVFDPSVQIQKTDALFDWTKMTTIELMGVDYEDNYPIGVDRRMLISNMTFEFPVWFSAPANIKDDFVKDIYARIGTVSNSAITNEDMIADMDAQGLEYELWFDGDTLDLPDF
jgi:hypothetical protein